MTPRLGSTVYERTTGEAYLVISDSATIWLRSDDGRRLRQYSPKSFRLRRAPNCMSSEGRQGIRSGIAKRYPQMSREAAVAKYGERLVELADANRLSYEQAAEAMQ